MRKTVPLEPRAAQNTTIVSSLLPLMLSSYSGILSVNLPLLGCVLGCRRTFSSPSAYVVKNGSR